MHRAGPRIRRGGPPNRGGANRRGSAFGDGVPMLGSLDGSSVDRDKVCCALASFFVLSFIVDDSFVLCL